MNINSYILGGSLLILTLPAWGQVVPRPGAILEQQRQQRDLLRRQQNQANPKRVPEDAVQDEVTPKSTGKPPAKSAKFMLRRVKTGASDVLSESDIQAITAPYVGRQVTIADLFALVADFNKAYKRSKVIGAKAVLPPQKIKDGMVTIRLIEGRVGTVRVAELRDTRPDYITDRLALESGRLLYLDDLEERLFRFNSLNDIKIRAVLKPGETFGSTDYEMRAAEPQRRSYNVFADNAGTSDVGEYRMGFNYTDNSLTGRRDVLGLGAHKGEGSRGVYVSYNIPVGTKGTRLGLSADYSDIEIIDGLLEPLNVTGDSWNLGLFATHPLHVGRDYVMNGFAGFNAKSSSTDFDDVTLFNTDVRTLSMGIDAEAHDLDGSWYTRHYLTFGPDGAGNDTRFTKYNGEGSWVKILPNQWVVTLRGKVQLSDQDLMPSSEQFQVGGMSTVRGYPEGLLIGDQGYMFSAEASIPWPGDDSFGDPFAAQARALMFFDHGAAFPFKGNNEDTDRDDYLTSVGLGLQINLGPKLRGRIVVAQPLFQREDNEDGTTLHFYLESTPF